MNIIKRIKDCLSYRSECIRLKQEILDLKSTYEDKVHKMEDEISNLNGFVKYFTDANALLKQDNSRLYSIINSKELLLEQYNIDKK